MSEIIKTVLLTALPASGKSEARTYLDSLSAEECRTHFHMGETVQLDDYPYVHLMRCIDDELEGMGKERPFFASADKGFRDTRDWGTLLVLINEDYDDLVQKREVHTDNPTLWLLARYDRARKEVGGDAITGGWDDATIEKLSGVLHDEIAKLIAEKNENIPATLEDKTVVIEFARGGPHDSAYPLPFGYGYGYSLPWLSDAILDDAAMLYIWVTPEQSRAKNIARAKPDAQGSILNHGVPEYVMMNDYGTDDLEYMMSLSDRPDTVNVETRGKSFYVPVGRFDNREDYTTFLRDDPKSWTEKDIEPLRRNLNDAFSRLWTQYKRIHKK